MGAMSKIKPLPFRGGVGVGPSPKRLAAWKSPTPSPSTEARDSVEPEGEGR
jgi:hypothetical protein